MPWATWGKMGPKWVEWVLSNAPVYWEQLEKWSNDKNRSYLKDQKATKAVRNGGTNV